MALIPSTPGFRDTQEFAFRKSVRDAIKKAGFTKSYRDVTLAIVNLWLHRKSHVDGVIHPGREKIAKKAGVTVKTVSRTMAGLRDAGVLETVSHAHGGWNSSTRYKVNLVPLFGHCGCRLPEWIPGDLVEQNVPQGMPEMSRKMGDKMSHGNNSVGRCPNQEWSFVDEDRPFRVIVGGRR